jgi:hypothetical protein
MTTREEYEKKVSEAERAVVELLKSNEELPLRQVLDTLSPPPAIRPEVLSAALTHLLTRGEISLDAERTVRLA